MRAIAAALPFDPEAFPQQFFSTQHENQAAAELSKRIEQYNAGKRHPLFSPDDPTQSLLASSQSDDLEMQVGAFSRESRSGFRKYLSPPHRS